MNSPPPTLFLPLALRICWLTLASLSGPSQTRRAGGVVGRGGPSHSASLPRFNNHILFKSKSGLSGLQPWHQQPVFYSTFKGDEAFKARRESRPKDSVLDTFQRMSPSDEEAGSALPPPPKHIVRSVRCLEL